MPDKTVNNFESLSGSRPTLVQCAYPIAGWSPRCHSLLEASSKISLCSIQPSVKATGQDKLTKSTLLNLFGRKGEGGEQFHYYLHQNGFQGLRKRDLAINTKSAKELVEGREQIYERVVTRTNVFDRLWGSNVTEICKWDRRIRDIR